MLMTECVVMVMDHRRGIERSWMEILNRRQSYKMVMGRCLVNVASMTANVIVVGEWEGKTNTKTAIDGIVSLFLRHHDFVKTEILIQMFYIGRMANNSKVENAIWFPVASDIKWQ